jgi:hypothetical protein
VRLKKKNIFDFGKETKKEMRRRKGNCRRDRKKARVLFSVW